MKIDNIFYRKAIEKLRKRKELDDYINVCLEAKICPECGEDLYSRGEGTSHPPVTLFDCSKCQFTWKEVRPVGRVKIQDTLVAGGEGNPILLNTSFPTEPPVEKKAKEKRSTLSQDDTFITGSTGTGDK